MIRFFALAGLLGLLAGCTPNARSADSVGNGPSPAGNAEQSSLRFVGRVDRSDPAGARFAWSGSGFVARFQGSSVSVKLSAGQFTVLVDGAEKPKLVADGNMTELASGLAPGEHTVEVYRRTEANQGESQLLGIDFGSGKALPPSPAPARRLEIVGDSITCGYGNEGPNRDCHFSPDTENHYLSYAALTARALGAELHTIAWSGKGVVCNYGDGASSCVDPLPTYYERTLPARADSRWDFSQWQAQAVVVNLGTNDFSTQEDPTPAEFEAAYKALLARIRTNYPEATILLTNGPMLGGADLTLVRTSLQNIVTSLNDPKIKAFELAPTAEADGWGCDWHPSLATHRKMADQLTAVLKTALAW
ncbi:MAG: SGNH/GDSL hydrolase family protein [Polyangiaceae bacterium]